MTHELIFYYTPKAISLLVDYASLCPYSNSLTSFRRLFFAGDLLASGRLRAF